MVKAIHQHHSVSWYNCSIFIWYFTRGC